MKIKNLGPISEISLELMNGLIFIGPNNSGKTYLTYTLYSILNIIDSTSCDFLNIEQATELLKNGKISVNLDELINKLAGEIFKKFDNFNEKILPEFFNISKEHFEKTILEISKEEIIGILQFLYLDYMQEGNEAPIPLKGKLYWAKSEIKTYYRQIDISVEYIGENVKSDISQDVDIKEFRRVINSYTIKRLFFKINSILYIPAERNGLNVFRKELLANRSNLFDERLSNRKHNTKYPKPISDYLNYLNLIDIHSFFDTNDAQLYNLLSETVIKGKFEKINDDIFYRQFYRRKKERLTYKKQSIPFHAASSSAKSLFGLDVYFEHLLMKNDILFIDEPEMNLDPVSQVRMAEFLVKCIDFGLKIIISTHSYNLVKAIITESLENKDRNVALIEYNETSNTFVENKELYKTESIPIFDRIDEELIDNYYEALDRVEAGSDSL